MSESRNTFFESVTVNADGTQKVVYSDATTTVKRSQTVYAPAYSRICVNISGTATVLIKSNPFGVNAMDVTLATLTASGEHLLQYGAVIVLDVTAVSGMVTAILVPGDD